MTLSPRQKEQIADQLLAVIEQLYVHRRMKMALYGVDPRALLRKLHGDAARMPDDTFNRTMRSIVTQIRDRHTRYSYAGVGANYWLPFTIERAFDGSEPTYLISKSQDTKVPVGSTVFHWNGVPLEFVVRELEKDIGAGNDAARAALARMFLTQRPASRFDPPNEIEIILDIQKPDGSMLEVRSAWSSSNSPKLAMTPTASPSGLGVDPDLLLVSRRVFETFSPQFVELAAQVYPNVRARAVRHAGNDFGYLRIFDFNVDDADDFAKYVADLLKTLPTGGVVIDLRGNPGGYIKAGELLLQLFTSRKIAPHGFRFRASDAVDYMIKTSDSYSSWQPTVAQGARLGAEHSAAFPIQDDEAAFNQIGRVYPGPSVLVVDALTFSTADMFTAGYKDHGIGLVVCADENIAAGGANNWPYDILRASFPGFLLPVAAEPELDKGVLGTDVRAAFALNDRALPGDATVGALPPDRLGRLWNVSAGALTYLVGKRDWLRKGLAVYFEGDNPFIHDLPPGVDFGFSIRQALRRNVSDGLVLEDDGIVADQYYRMSRKDVLSANEDLIDFACSLLSRQNETNRTIG